MSEQERLSHGQAPQLAGSEGAPGACASAVLDAVLSRRPERLVDFEVDDEGRVTVLEPKFTGPILGRLLPPRLAQPHIRTHLDEVGSVVWQACDGDTDVRAIAARLAERFGPEFDPEHQRLAAFLHTMQRRGLIR